jgi:hypothetical protein
MDGEVVTLGSHILMLVTSWLLTQNTLVPAAERSEQRAQVLATVDGLVVFAVLADLVVLDERVVVHQVDRWRVMRHVPECPDEAGDSSGEGNEYGEQYVNGHGVSPLVSDTTDSPRTPEGGRLGGLEGELELVILLIKNTKHLRACSAAEGADECSYWMDIQVVDKRGICIERAANRAYLPCAQ